MNRAALLAVLLAAPRPAPAIESSPLQGTAGAHLREVWAQARSKYPDAKLISITGASGADGKARCSPDAAFQNGWRFTFYAPATEEFVMMAECGGTMAGPLLQLRSKAESLAKLTVSGKFIDSDQALRTLAKGGIKLGEIEAKTPGKRPFALSLALLEDDRLKVHPAVWRIAAGGEIWFVDALRNEKLDPARYGLDYAALLSSAAANSSTLAERPKKGDVYTAKTDLERALAYARDHFPEAGLMAVEGFADAWGGSPCTGPGDGWAYYFYNPRRRDFDVVFACNGYVGPGPTRYIPVDTQHHEVISGPTVDSDAVIDSALVTHGDVFSEGMGRKYSRHATLLLRQYKTPPFSDPALWKVKLLWELTIGRTLFRFDAANARLLDVR